MKITLVFNLQSGDVTAFTRLSKVTRHYKGLNADTIRNHYAKHRTDTYFTGHYKVQRVELR